MLGRWFLRRFWKAALVGAAFGLALCLFEFGLDFLVLHSHDLPRWTVYIVDAITGTVATLLFMRIFTLQAAREANTEHRLRTIAEMNHHIRNALQVISYCASERDQREVRMLKESVERIEWALRDLLPRIETNDVPPGKPAARVPPPGRAKRA